MTRIVYMVRHTGTDRYLGHTRETDFFGARVYSQRGHVVCSIGGRRLKSGQLEIVEVTLTLAVNDTD